MEDIYYKITLGLFILISALSFSLYGIGYVLSKLRNKIMSFLKKRPSFSDNGYNINGEDVTKEIKQEIIDEFD